MDTLARFATSTRVDTLAILSIEDFDRWSAQTDPFRVIATIPKRQQASAPRFSMRRPISADSNRMPPYPATRATLIAAEWGNQPDKHRESVFLFASPGRKLLQFTSIAYKEKRS